MYFYFFIFICQFQDWYYFPLHHLMRHNAHTIPHYHHNQLALPWQFLRKPCCVLFLTSAFLLQPFIFSLMHLEPLCLHCQFWLQLIPWVVVYSHGVFFSSCCHHSSLSISLVFSSSLSLTSLSCYYFKAIAMARLFKPIHLSIVSLATTSREMLTILFESPCHNMFRKESNQENLFAEVWASKEQRIKYMLRCIDKYPLPYLSWGWRWDDFRALGWKQKDWLMMVVVCQHSITVQKPCTFSAKTMHPLCFAH